MQATHNFHLLNATLIIKFQSNKQNFQLKFHTNSYLIATNDDKLPMKQDTSINNKAQEMNSKHSQSALFYKIETKESIKY